jgi:hypothetical protein
METEARRECEAAARTITARYRLTTPGRILGEEESTAVIAAKMLEVSRAALERAAKEIEAVDWGSMFLVARNLAVRVRALLGGE